MTDSIQAFLDQWSAAELAGDTERLAAMLTDDFVAVGPLGFILPRQAWLGRHSPGELSYESFALAEVQTRVHGQAAIVTARNNTIGSYKGHPVPEAARITLVLIGDDGSWRLAAAHVSFLAGTRGSPPIPGAPPASGAAPVPGAGQQPVPGAGEQPNRA
jgi:ketosteroid isomerase-like protein